MQPVTARLHISGRLSHHGGFADTPGAMLQTYPTDDNLGLCVAVQGSGPAVLFLHGWTSSHREWLSYAEPLSDAFCTYCRDARGHGEHNPRAAAALTVQRMADDLHDLIVHFSLDHPLLVGHSMGALTAWEYIRRYGSADLGGLVVIDQSPKLITDSEWSHGIYGEFPAPRNDHFIARCEADFAESVLRLVGEGNNARARAEYASDSDRTRRIRAYLRQLDAAPLIEVWKSLTLQDYRAVLPNIGVPTLLIHGDESHFYSVEVAKYLRERIPRATLHVYEGSDHSPHLWQRERFLKDLRDFAQHTAGRGQP